MTTLEAEKVDPRDLETQGLIDSIIARAERILARDLAAPVVQRALVRLSQDKTIKHLLYIADTADTVDQFDVNIRETPDNPA
jgi:hypothetical protein